MYACRVASDRMLPCESSSTVCTSTPVGSPVKHVQWQAPAKERAAPEEAPTVGVSNRQRVVAENSISQAVVMAIMLSFVDSSQCSVM